MMDLKLTELIKNTITKQESAPRNYIGASIIGNDCDRAIWYQANGYTDLKVNHKLKRTFDLGKSIEKMIINYLVDAGCNLVLPSEDNNYLECSDPDFPFFKGHMDALLILNDGKIVILDVKSCKSDSYQSFIKRGIKGWNPTYYAQLQSYLGMKKYEHAGIIAFNKDTSELAEEYIQYDDIFYHAMKEKAKKIYFSKEIPEKINRSPLFFKCNMCSYKEVCHS